MRGFTRPFSPLRACASLSSRLPPLRHRCASTPSLPLSPTAATTNAGGAGAAVTTSQRPTPPRPRPLNPTARLSPEEIAQINRLVPRLCESNHLQEAVRLLDACLLTDPDLGDLPLPALVRRLCCGDEPDMTHAMALLTALLHNPRCSPGNIGVICSMLIDSYLEHRRPREALKVFDWMRRPKSPCPPEPHVYGTVVQGLCRHGKTLEALRVLRAMAGGYGCEVVGSDVRTCVYRSLLREARVRVAQELDRALASVGGGDDTACGRALELLDRTIRNWQD